MSTKLQKIKKVVPSVNFRKMADIMKKYIEEHDDISFDTPSDSGTHRNKTQPTSKKSKSTFESLLMNQRTNTMMTKGGKPPILLNTQKTQVKKNKSKFSKQNSQLHQQMIFDEPEGFLFSKLQAAIREQVNSMLNSNYIKVMVLGLNELLESE